MDRIRGRRATSHPVDAEGELVDSPTSLRYLWLVIVVLVGLEVAGELRVVGGPTRLYRFWLHDLLLAGAAALMLARAWYEPIGRRAWTAFGLATAVWCVGSVAWSVVYGDTAHPPYPTVADVLWLLWYPLTGAGIVLLIRVRFRRFELHRWLDGIAVTLLVLVVGFALVIQPVAEHSAHGWLATVVDFSYPVLDILLIGAVLGVYGLLGWRPDAMWVLIGMGILAMTVADAVFAVQQARSTATGDRYDYVWTLGAMLIAYAGWVPSSVDADGHQQVTGVRAIALALLAQVLAIGIQVYALFEEVGKSERIVTVIVLVVASVQIVLSRPRADSRDAPEDGPAPVDAPAAFPPSGPD